MRVPHAIACSGTIVTDIPDTRWCPVCGVLQHAGSIEPVMPQVVVAVMALWDEIHQHDNPVPVFSYDTAVGQIADAIHGLEEGHKVLLRFYSDLHKEVEELRKQNKALVESNNANIEKRRKAEALYEELKHEALEESLWRDADA